MKAYCIYGPPGTGKTTELIRLINDVRDRNPQARINFLSHTRVAAREAVSRPNCKLSPDHASTIHSMCYRLLDLSRSQVVDYAKLREFGSSIGMPISGESPDSERDLTDGDILLAIYDKARNSRMQPQAEYERTNDAPLNLASFEFLFQSYENWKDSFGYVDFTDMLTLALHKKVRPAVDVFFIDEAQDLTPLQHLVLYEFLEGAKLAYAAGDDDQTIFEWSGADPRGMVQFEQRFDAERKVLNQSWRIPRVVHELAQSVIGRVMDRVEKVYRPREEEGTLLRESFVEHLSWDEPLTFLYRDRSVRKPVEELLLDACVPYRTTVGWPSPLESKAGRTIKMLSDFFRSGELDPRHARVLEDRLTERGKKALSTGRKTGTWSDLVKMRANHSYYLDRVGDQEPRITLSSIHSFKGAEADHIVLSNGMSMRVASNLIEKPDEEHRVFYVGVTRAKHKLTIVEGENPYDI